MAFDNFPYTNFHELNADWMLQTLKTLRANVEAAIQSMESVLGSLEQYNQRLSELEAGAVMFTEDQDMTAAEQATARENIGAISQQDLADSAVRYDVRQQLTPTQQENARGNIGAAPSLGVVRYDQVQTLTDSQKTQARQNIGAISTADIPSETGTVKYDQVQTLTDSQKAQARQNIGAISRSDIPDVTGTVRYDQLQTLADYQKALARQNISAAATADIPNVSDVIRYSAQNLTANQKAQARANIGASSSEVQPLSVQVYPNGLQTGYECDTSVTDIIDAADNGRPVIIIFTPVNSDTKYQCTTTINSADSPNIVIAHAYNPEGPGAQTDFNWYRIYMTAGSGSDTLEVTQLSGRLIPSSQASDAGMLLAVSNTGRPTWVQKDPTVVSDLVSSSITLAALDNTEYNYGELSALTITSIPTIGEFSIVFVSGSTPTTLSIPQTMIMPDNFSSVEANTRYEINVKNGYALVGSWAVSA